MVVVTAIITGTMTPDLRELDPFSLRDPVLRLWRMELVDGNGTVCSLDEYCGLRADGDCRTGQVGYLTAES